MFLPELTASHRKGERIMHGVHKVKTRKATSDAVKGMKIHASESKFVPEVCPTCGGTGAVYDYNAAGDVIGVLDCPACGGTGEK
jgi:DnaJ-class molecular chaperone